MLEERERESGGCNAVQRVALMVGAKARNDMLRRRRARRRRRRKRRRRRRRRRGTHLSSRAAMSPRSLSIAAIAS